MSFNINMHFDEPMLYNIHSSAYRLKALELVNSTALSLCLSAHLGYAGISRQLHPMKAKDLITHKVNKIKQKKDIQGSVYWLKALKVANSTIPMYWQSAAQRGCAGIGRQLHPLEVKRKKNKTNKILLDLYFARAWILETLRAICELLLIFAMFQRSMTT